MEKWIGDLLLDTSPPEKPKFNSPLVFAHGLWSGSWCWQPWATHFANLGWECWAVNFRGRFEKNAPEVLKEVDFQRCVEDLSRVVRSTIFPPILVGHSLGGLIAQKVAEKESLSALVLLSSLPPQEVPLAPSRTLRLLRLKYFPLIWLRRSFRPEERDFARSWLASVAGHRRMGIYGQSVPESSHLVSEFFGRRVRVEPGRIACPVLVIGGREDRVVPVDWQKVMAKRLVGEFLEYAGHGHWIMQEEGTDKIISDLHRWLVQKLGDKILLAQLP